MVFDGACFVLFGLTACGCALFRWYHPSWGSAWRLGAFGLGCVAIGAAAIAIEIIF
jgi:hypothetical protein